MHYKDDDDDDDDDYDDDDDDDDDDDGDDDDDDGDDDDDDDGTYDANLQNGCYMMIKIKYFSLIIISVLSKCQRFLCHKSSQ